MFTEGVANSLPHMHFHNMGSVSRPKRKADEPLECVADEPLEVVADEPLECVADEPLERLADEPLNAK